MGLDMNSNEIDYTKLIMGKDAISVPFNFIRQECDEDKGLILGQETGIKLAFGSTMPHVLVLGDMVFRPHVVIESKHCVGMGAAAIITSSFDVSEWIRNGDIILNKYNRISP